ncbi:MAG: undecaprenyl diphosphate synthase family protein [Candidatus Levyibacteriota bacterium]
MTIHEGSSQALSVEDRYPRLKEAPSASRPKVVVFIPDGNIRWANGLGIKDTIEGHRAGARKMFGALELITTIPEVETVMTWGYSHDNWSRPNQEIRGIMRVLEETTKRALPIFHENKIRFKRLGRPEKIRAQFGSLWRTLEVAERETEQYTDRRFGLLLDFNGDDQELRMAQQLSNMIRQNPSLLVTEDLWNSLRDGWAEGFRPADLVIRTSGEMRTSGLGWPGDRAEFVSIEANLPDMTNEHVVETLVEYSQRDRRFGGRPTSLIHPI